MYSFFISHFGLAGLLFRKVVHTLVSPKSSIIEGLVLRKDKQQQHLVYWQKKGSTVLVSPKLSIIAETTLRFLRRSEFLGSFVSIPTLSRGEFMGTSAQWRSPKNHLGYCVKVRSYPSYLPHFPTYCIANTAANLATDSYPYHPTLSSTRCLPNPPPHIFTQEE